MQVVNNETNESNFKGGNYYVEISVKGLIVIANLDGLRKVKADEETMKAIQIWDSRNEI